MEGSYVLVVAQLNDLNGIFLVTAICISRTLPSKNMNGVGLAFACPLNAASTGHGSRAIRAVSR